MENVFVNKFKELSTETIKDLLVAISHNFGSYKKVDGWVFDYTKYMDLEHELLKNYVLNKEFFKKEYPSFDKMSFRESAEIKEKYNQHCNPCYGMDVIYLLLEELRIRK